MLKSILFIIIGGIVVAGTSFLSQTASASTALCQALQNGATWTARDNSRNAGKTGKIKLSGGCARGASGTASIVWDDEAIATTYKVGHSVLFVGRKGYRTRLNDNGFWTVFNTSSPL